MPDNAEPSETPIQRHTLEIDPTLLAFATRTLDLLNQADDTTATRSGDWHLDGPIRIGIAGEKQDQFAFDRSEFTDTWVLVIP